MCAWLNCSWEEVEVSTQTSGVGRGKVSPLALAVRKGYSVIVEFPFAITGIDLNVREM